MNLVVGTYWLMFYGHLIGIKMDYFFRHYLDINYEFYYTCLVYWYLSEYFWAVFVIFTSLGTWLYVKLCTFGKASAVFIRTHIQVIWLLCVAYYVADLVRYIKPIWNGVGLRGLII